jgi:hypothetical protein
MLPLFAVNVLLEPIFSLTRSWACRDATAAAQTRWSGDALERSRLRTSEPRCAGAEPRNRAGAEERNRAGAGTRWSGAVEPRWNGAAETRWNGAVEPRWNGAVEPRWRWRSGDALERRRAGAQTRWSADALERNRAGAETRWSGDAETRWSGVAQPRWSGVALPKVRRQPPGRAGASGAESESASTTPRRSGDALERRRQAQI